jgi:DNA modification methylase
VNQSGRNWDLLIGDCRDMLATLTAKSVQTCITSPPYWGLRDYGVDGQIGLEETPDDFLAGMVDVFAAVWRVLRDDGTAWVNMGDSYASSPASGGAGQQEGGEHKRTPRRTYERPEGLKPKDLCGMPWRLAFALQAAGWYLRSDIIWSKPNPMPESCTDRPTKAHEYVFLLTKRPRYFYDADAVRETAEYGRGSDFRAPRYIGNNARDNAAIAETRTNVGGTGGTRNRRTVWAIPTQAYSEAHFATFPEALVVPCILAGTSERGACPACGSPWVRVVERGEKSPRTGRAVGYDYGTDKSDPGHNGRRSQRYRPTGAELAAWRSENPDITTGWQPSCDCEPADPVPCTVLDPFAGSGTTGKVAVELGRRFVGCELNPEYAELAAARIRNQRKYAAPHDTPTTPLDGQGELF